MVDIIHYYQSISKYKLLTREEEVNLARKCQAGCIESRNKLITSNLRLVILIARKHIRRGMPFDDLVGAGNIGLFTAARKFDPEKGFKFSTYATLWITQSILRTIESSGRIRIPSYLQFIRRRIDRIKNIMALKGEHNISIKSIIRDSVVKGHNPTNETISCVIMSNEIHNVISTDSITTEQSIGDITLRDVIKNDDIREALNIIEGLPERSKLILKMKFGIDSYEPMSLFDIGSSLTPILTKERIRQIIAESISIIRERMIGKKIDSIGSNN